MLAGMEDVLELNVGGSYFTTTRSTLCKEPASTLARMFAGDLAPSQVDKQGRYFIDRSGDTFGAVLAYLRGEELHRFCARDAVQEAQYYQVIYVTRYCDVTACM